MPGDPVARGRDETIQNTALQIDNVELNTTISCSGMKSPAMSDKVEKAPKAVTLVVDTADRVQRAQQSLNRTILAPEWQEIKSCDS